MKAAELLVRCLENEGVQLVFGLPGEETLELMDAFLDSRTRFIETRHEQGAAFMADVYGRLSGKAGVCLSTLGPGATNLLTGVVDANLDRAPLVALTGQAASEVGLARLRFAMPPENEVHGVTPYACSSGARMRARRSPCAERGLPPRRGFSRVQRPSASSSHASWLSAR